VKAFEILYHDISLKSVDFCLLFIYYLMFEYLDKW